MGKNIDFGIFWALFEEEHSFYWAENLFFSFFPENIGHDTSYIFALDFLVVMTSHLASDAHV